MFTKNWHAWARIMGSYANMSAEFKLKDGSSYTYTYSDLFGSAGTYGYQWIYALNASYNTTGNYGVAFGSGNTAPTKDDYDIENIINDLQVQTPSTPVPLYGEDYDEYRCTYAVTATTECTISEIGLFARGYKSGFKTYLVDHTVLDEPIHLNAGEGTNITYTFRFYH